jgi:TPP-dependent 2-oxoacid decarboxylase
MQYGSIGWSVGATLGYAQAVPEKRVIACIGDGSFQVCLVHHNYLINISITKMKLFKL